MAIEHYVKVNGAWRAGRENPSAYVKVGGVWRPHVNGSQGKWVKVNGQWREAASSAPVPPAGQYFLSPISQDLVGSSGHSSYNTTDYQGRITEIRARVSWKQQTICIAGLAFQVAGRPNGNHYRQITSDSSWCGRTIDHRIDTFDASSLTDFNSGAATGFSYSTSGLALEGAWTNVQLGLTIT